MTKLVERQHTVVERLVSFFDAELSTLRSMALRDLFRTYAPSEEGQQRRGYNDKYFLSIAPSFVIALFRSTITWALNYLGTKERLYSVAIRLCDKTSHEAVRADDVQIMAK